MHGFTNYLLLILLFLTIGLAIQLINMDQKSNNCIELKERLKKLTVVNCTITAYSNRKSETDETPMQTALMEKPVSGWTCAVSRDLKYMLGRKIYIENYGVRKVNDLMNKKFSERIDLFIGNTEKALKFGKKKDLKVTLIGKED